MSDDLKRNFQEDLALSALMEKKKAELQADELEIKKFKIEAQKKHISEVRENLERAKNTSFGILPESEVDKMVKDSEDYIDAAKHAMTFINKEAFKSIVPFFRKNIILIGAKTGEGKSTAIANIARGLISELNPETKKARRILVISNEEKREDFYNRITCLILGWSYTNHDKFTEEQKKTFSKYIKLLSKVITVIDDSHGGGTGMTTTLEGLQMIFENMIRDGDYYDAILIDYYQNFRRSQKNFAMNEYDVQSSVAALLDQYKNVYPAPIVIMSQIKPIEPGEELNAPFETRIKGRKEIIVKSTFVMEMVTDRKTFTTSWIIHKGRFSENVGNTIETGYDRGRYVFKGPEFKKKVLEIIEKRNREAMNRAAGTNFMDMTKEETKNAEIPQKTSSSGSDPVSGKAV